MRTIIIYGRLQDTEYILITFKNQMKNQKKILVIAMKVTRRVPHVEQELLTSLEHLNSPSIYTGNRDVQFLFFC